MRKKVTRIGYRVDVLSVTTEQYEGYTSPKEPVTLAMATSLADHLKRSKVGGRIVELSSDTVIDEWKRAYEPQDPNVLRDRVQAIRDRFPCPTYAVENKPNIVQNS